MNYSLVQNFSHRLIHTFKILRISLFASGTSFTQYILREGPCSIFLIVPEVDLKTASVTIWSRRMGSGRWPPLRKVKVSNVEKVED